LGAAVIKCNDSVEDVIVDARGLPGRIAGKPLAGGGSDIHFRKGHTEIPGAIRRAD
jgi:hypothetical protein